MPGINEKFLPAEKLEQLGFKRLGNGVLIHETVVIVDCSLVAIDDNVRIDPYCVISCSGGVEIGSNVHIASHCTLTGRAPIRLSDFAGISHGVKLFTSNDDYSGQTLSGPTVPARFKNDQHGAIEIGRHAILGANTVVLPAVTIGEGSVTGAFSYVNKSLEPWGVFVGIPVKRIKNRKRDLLELELEFNKRASSS